MENKDLEKYHNEILSYIEKYENKVSKDNAREVIDSFNEDWMNPISDDNDLGKALILYSFGILELETLSKDEVECLSERIKIFDSVKYKFGIKTVLFGNLALCWHKLGIKHKENSTYSFKKYIYYLIIESYRTSYNPIAYKFRACNEYLSQSLINESIGLTSPGYFNDPFDCPILELLNNDEEVSQMIRHAYNECLKIACFSSNIKLPRADENTQEMVSEEKQPGAKFEYLNELMWAHYADSHKGVCIKYHFPNSLTKLAHDNDSVICFFGDVIYSDKDISQYSNKDRINMKDSFFLKGKQWEYENELRLLYFNIEGKEGFHSIEVKNCIEAVYFGLKCSKEDQSTIINILKDKKHIKTDLKENKTEYPIKFYKMVIDKQHFGQVKAVEIKPDAVSKNC